jgi:orotidine-5'-phosphate decarboxylase
MSLTFGEKLGRLQGSKRLCVGIDPHQATLSAWGFEDDQAGLARFSETLVEGCVEAGVALVKPQVALFERHGIAGMAVLAQTISRAREAGILVIADVKRGDIGTSLAGYAEAWLGAGSDWESDAMTAVAYQGVGSLEPAFVLAAKEGKGVFVLAATSNPEGWPLQSAMTGDGHTVAQRISDELTRRSHREPRSRDGWLGLVVGATVNRDALGLSDDTLQQLPLLVPGFGAQGVGLSEIRERLGALAHAVIPAVSRSVAGDNADGVGQRIAEHQAELTSTW